MNQEQYKLGWRIACWSTLAITLCSLLSIVSSVFGILQAISLGAVAFGFFTVCNELVKAQSPAATPMKSAYSLLFIISGLFLISSILGMTVKIDSLSDGKALLIFAGLFEVGCGVLFIKFKAQITEALKQIGIVNGLFGAGILVYAIALIVVGFGFFVFGIAPSTGSLGLCGITTILGGIAALVGAIIWIVGMFQVTEQATK